MDGDGNRDIRRALLLASIPAMIQLLLKMGVGMVNKLMVGQLGEAAIAGVGASEQVIFLLLMVFAAVSTGVTTLAAQHLGAGDRASIRTVLGSGLVFGVLAALPITLALLGLAGDLLAWMGATPEIVAEGSAYLKIVSLAVPSVIASFILTAIFRAFSENKLPMFASLGAILLDVSLSYHFLFVARKGVAGVACAALIARNAELLFLLAALQFRGRDYGISLRHALAFSRTTFGKLVRIGWPVSVDMFIWQAGSMLAMLIVLRLGTIMSGVNELAKLVPGWILTPVMGISATATAFVGRDLGRGHFEGAQRQASETLRLALLITLAMSLSVCAAAPFIPGFFRFTDEGTRYGVYAILFAALTQVMVFPTLICPSILRAGGDTKIIIPITAAGLALGLPAAYLLGITLHLGLLGVMAGQALGDLAKAAIFYARYRQGAWRQKLV